MMEPGTSVMQVPEMQELYHVTEKGNSASGARLPPQVTSYNSQKRGNARRRSRRPQHQHGSSQVPRPQDRVREREHKG